MTIHEDIAIIEQQEQLLQFTAFDAYTAWKVGCLLREKLLAASQIATFEIEVNGQTLFAAITQGANPGQADWVRRKRNSVRRFRRSSYLTGRMLERDGETLESRHGLTLADYAYHGGGFPILLKGTGPVGSVVLSGLPQREDHKLVTNTLAEVLGIPIPQLD